MFVTSSGRMIRVRRKAHDDPVGVRAPGRATSFVFSSLPRFGRERSRTRPVVNEAMRNACHSV